MCSNKDKKGLVLVTVLWVVVVLMVIVAILGRKSRLDTKVCFARREALRCKWACRAGIEKAIAVLNEDKTEDETEGNVLSDSLVDLWSDNDEDFNDVLLENCWFNVRIIDEASKLNINTVTKDQLLALPYMVEEIADAIIDWRDNDDTPSGAGVESGYYESLPFGYLARDGSFRTIRELLLVKDVTEELLYGEDTNFNGQLDYNERDGDENPPVDDGDSELDLGWIAYLTCYTPAESQSSQDQTNQNQGGQNQDNQNQDNQNQSSQNQGDRNQNNQNQSSQNQSDQNQDNQNQNNQNQNNQNQNQNNQSASGQTYAKVNINTASMYVLAALLGGGDTAEQTAEDIIAYRETLDYGIESTTELTQISSINNNTFANIENYITVRSDVFTIYCLATADRGGTGGLRLQTEAVVDRSSSPCEILYWYQGVSN
ncbi:MAG: type II secretion system minor pseudopilin [Planctomycetota bacterium]|jgi:type II secretory pathway component PulK